MNELKNVDVHLISFVDKAANKRKFIYKSADIKEDDPSINIQKEVKIVKVDEEKRLVYGAVYAPNEDEGDAHEDFMTADEIEKAAHNFLAKSNTVKATDTQHNLQPVEGVTIVESAVLKGTHEILKDEKPGTWYIVTKVDNDEVWKSVKDGTYTGYSLYGFAEKVENAKSDDTEGLLKKFYSWLKKDENKADVKNIIKSFDEVYSKMQLNTIVNAISCAIYDVSYNDMLSVSEKLDEIKRVMVDASAKMDTIEIAKSLLADPAILKAGKVLSDANMKKVQAALEAIQSILDAANTAKSKIEKLKKSLTDSGENNMETITKADHDKAIKELTEKHDAEKAELQKKLDDQILKTDELDKDLKELAKNVNDVIEASKGSAQVDGEGDEKKKAVNFNMIGDEVKKKFNIK